MLPDTVAIKGGMGVKLRFGERGTRATSDLDVSTRARGEDFERSFRERLAAGWGTVPPSKGEQARNPAAAPRVAFTATVGAVRLHDPGLARPEYVMHPYRVSLSFLGKAWGALDVEVSDPRSLRTHTRGRRSTANSCSSVNASGSGSCSRWIASETAVRHPEWLVLSSPADSRDCCADVNR